MPEIKIKKNCFLVVTCLILLFLVSAAILADGKTEKGSAATQEYAYALLLDEYTVPNFTNDTQIEGPNGRDIPATDGKIVFTDTGRYSVLYPDGSILYIEVYEYVPLFEFTYSGQFDEKYDAGDTVLFPAATIKSAVETAKTYTVILEQDGKTVDTYENVSGSFSRKFETAGEYVVYYCYRDVFGYLTNDSKEFRVENNRNLIVPEIPEEWYFNTAYRISEYYGYYNETKYEATMTVIDPDGNRIETEESFLPLKTGEYIFTFESEVDGEVLTKTLTTTIVYDYSGYFTPGNDITSVMPTQMPSYVVPSSSGKGVEIRAEKTGATVYYNRIIDLREYTYEDNLISFYPLSDSTSKLTEIKISLVDVYDEDNVVTVQFWGSTEAPNHSYVLASNGSGFYGRNNDGVNADQKLREKWGSVAFFNSFNSAAYPENIAFTVQYDWSTNQVLSKLYYEQQIIYDLDDDTIGGRSNNWSGFTTGEVYLRIEFSGVSLKNSGIAVSEIAKTSFRNTVTAWSEEADFLKFDFSEPTESMPVGVTGRFYRLPVPTGYDIVSGHYEVSAQLIYDPDGAAEIITSAINGDGFTPDREGKYCLQYSAVSPFGSPVVREIEFEVAKSEVPIEIELGTYEETELDRYYKIPQVYVRGGSGTLDTAVKILYNDEEVFLNSAGKIYLNAPGEIVMEVTATDFLGTEKRETFTIPVTQEEPLVRISGVPEAVVAGEKTVFPDFTAYDLNKTPGESGYEMERSISVDGQALDMETREFTVPERSGYLNVCYVAGSGDRQVTKEYSVYIINNPAAPQDYMIYDRDRVAAETNLLETKFSSDEDFSVGFPYPLVSDGLTVNLDGSSTVSGNIFVRIEDYHNPDIAFTLTISDDGNQNSLIRLNKKTSGRISGKLGNAQNGRFAFIIDTDGYLKDTSGNRILLLDTCENGDIFTGFPSKTVRFRFGLEEVVSQTELGIVSVMGQTLNDFFVADGDLTGPTVLFRGDTNFSQVSVNDTIIVPAAEAYDVFHPDTSVTVTVRSPEGDTVYNRVSANTELKFTAEKYGYYSIVYEAYDGLFNRSEKRFNILVKDEIAPQVNVKGNIVSSIKTGAKFAVPVIEASDNVTENPIVICFIEKPDFSREIVEQGGEYVFTESGKYNFVVYVRDDSYNVVRNSYSIEVKK